MTKRATQGAARCLRCVGMGAPGTPYASNARGRPYATRRSACMRSASRAYSNPELATSGSLIELMDRPRRRVRKAAAELAINLRERPLQPFASLLEALIDSGAYADASPQLLITLEQAPTKVDALVLRVAQRFMSLYGRDAGDIRTSAAGDAHHVSWGVAAPRLGAVR